MLLRLAGKDCSPDENRSAGSDSFFPLPALPGVATWLWRPSRHHAVFAEEWRGILNLPADSPLGTDIIWLWDNVFHEERTVFRERCLACAEGRNDHLDMVVRLECADHHLRWMLIRGVAHTDAQGSERKVSGIACDVSHLRLDERFLLHSVDYSRVQQMLGKNSPDFIVRFDAGFFPLYINPVAATYLNMTTEQAVGKTSDELVIFTTDKTFFSRHVTSVFTSANVVKSKASFLSPKHGEVTGEFYFWPEFDMNGKVLYVICHMSDLSEQNRVEQELRRNEQRFSAMHQLGQMLDKPEDEIISFFVDQVALLTQSPYSYLYLPDFSASGKTRMSWSNNIHKHISAEKLPSDRIPQDCFTKDFTCEKTITSPIVVNNADAFGTHVAFDVLPIRRYMVVPTIEDGRVVAIASVCNKETDYTDADLLQLEMFIRGAWLILLRRRYIYDLRRAKESAERASRVKDVFLANISHELRTPLNGMLSMLQLLELSPLADEQLEYVRTASLSGNSLLRIISDILDFSRMAAGKMSLQEGSFDLRATLISTMNLFAGEARQRGLDISVTIDDALPPLLWGDDARVRQIIFNLAGNALKFTQQGGVRVDCSLLPYRKQEKCCIYLSVADTGSGIPPEAHSIIFESFTQVGSKTGKYGGTGLGLSIVRQLVLHMGGTLTVDSQEGEGTTIHCSLPFALPPQMADAPSLQIRSATPSSRGLDVLIAEDDPVGRFAIRTFLERIGHRVVCADSGYQALEALQIRHFDCLITDIQMPDMDGLETVRRIRQGVFADIRPSEEMIDRVRQAMPETPSTPRVIPQDLIVVALTAHAMRGDREHFLRMGMDLYLSKPIIMEELRKVMQQVILHLERKETSH